MLAMNSTVLHVDDDPVTTRVIAAQLRKFGIEVASINDPAGAMPCLLREHHRVVILDVDMPEIDGFDLLDQIKRYDSGIRVVMLTGRATTNTVIQSRQRGAEACFFKPLVNVGALADVIQLTTPIATTHGGRQRVSKS
jgi:DNA-binding NtrC family response regulator